MATYLKNQLINGRGVLCEALTGGQAYQFYWINQSVNNTPIYFTFEVRRDANEALKDNVNVAGAFSTLLLNTNIQLDSIVQSNLRWSVVIPDVKQLLNFTPTSTIPVNTVYLKGTGEMFSLTIS